MKKLIAMTLAIVLVFGLCACGQPKTNENLSKEEQLSILQKYETTVRELYNISATRRLTSAEVKTYYDTLTGLDLAVIDKWLGTEHTAADDVNWDYKSVLDDFVILKDVFLEYSETETIQNNDGSTGLETKEYHPNLVYDENGFMVFTEHDILEGPFFLVNGKFSLFVNDPLRLNSGFFVYENNGDHYPQYVLDEVGKLKEARWYKGKEANYRANLTEDKDPDCVCTYAYDEEGKLISQTVAAHYNYLVTYTYDENDRIVELYVDNKSENKNETIYTFEYDDAGHLIRSEEYDYRDMFEERTVNGVVQKIPYSINAADKCVYSYTCDDNGNIISVDRAYYIWNGKDWGLYGESTYLYTYDSNGNIVSETVTWDSWPDDHIRRFELIYGDYYIFNPNNN